MMKNSEDSAQAHFDRLGTGKAPVQINAKIDWILAMGAKRLAKQRGVPLNTYIADLIANDLSAEADTIRRQLAEEEQEFATEKEAMLAALDKFQP